MDLRYTRDRPGIADTGRRWRGLGLIPDRASAKIPAGGVSWDYTTWLDIVFLILAAVLLARFARTGGLAMLRMMGGAPAPCGAGAGHAHHSMDSSRPGGSSAAKIPAARVMRPAEYPAGVR
jgi:hypothetical protein